jgi:hypothetical protein
MAPSIMTQTLRLSAVALAAVTAVPVSIPATAQTVYREYEDGGVEPWMEDEDVQDYSAAPWRRQRPRALDDDDEDDRFERDDDDDIDDEEAPESGDRDRQGVLDLAPPAKRQAAKPPPSVDAKPAEKAWKPAL